MLTVVLSDLIVGKLVHRKFRYIIGIFGRFLVLVMCLLVFREILFGSFKRFGNSVNFSNQFLFILALSILYEQILIPDKVPTSS
jgi:hypothetical protein